MFYRLAIFASLLSYTWYSLLKIILIRKEIHRLQMDSSSFSKIRNLMPFKNWSSAPFFTMEEIELDFNHIELKDIVALAVFFLFTFYVAEIWRAWLYIFQRLWEPVIDMEVEQADVEEDPEEDDLEEEDEPEEGLWRPNLEPINEEDD